MTVLEDARTMAADLTSLRHELHADPEIGLELPRTQEKVLAALQGLPLEISTGTATTSVTAVLRGTASGTSPDGAAAMAGPAVLLRGDMDALPVQEAGDDLPYASRNAGVMHACGHDLHTAMLVGAARLLCRHRDRLHGDVVLMFQPGEEGWNGAGVMLGEGVLEAAGKPLSAAYALHVFSALIPQGQFVSRPGTVLSASDGLHVTVRGAGGHGSQPHTAKDPVTAVSAMVTGLQTMVTREFDIFDPVVVTVGSLHAGTKRNIIPDTATFDATVRTFSAVAQRRVKEAAPRLLQGIAAAHGVEAEVTYSTEYPATVNEAGEAAHVEHTVGEVFGAGRYRVLEQPLAASEDFSRVLGAVPGCFVGLGAAPAGTDPAQAPFNHSPRARYDDAVLADGAALYAELALRRLASAARP